MHVLPTVADRIHRIPDPQEPVPTVSWPIVGLLIAGLSLYLGSSGLYLANAWPWWATVLTNAVAGYLLFTVAHDAGHHSVSRVKWLNDLIGRLATPLFALHAAFPVWRFIHMQHHRFTNHDDGDDPDHYTMRGPSWQKPLRWVTIDYRYVSSISRSSGRDRCASRSRASASCWWESASRSR